MVDRSKIRGMETYEKELRYEIKLLKGIIEELRNRIEALEKQDWGAAINRLEGFHK